MKTQLMIATLCLATAARATEEHQHVAPKVSPTFESMKALIGTWEGKHIMNGKEQEAKVTYELTSGGSVITEKLAPGTPDEMLTVYANNGNTVTATHYCMLGNQPQMKLKKAANGVYAFEMEGTKGISNKNEMHMHAVTLTINGNKLKQEWTDYKDNKKDATKVLEFTKKD